MQLLLSQPIEWMKTGDATFPFATVIDGVNYQIRVNDFPAEPLYTLIRNTSERIIDFDTWPPAWRRS